MAWIGPAISAGASLLGGLLGRSAQAKANKQSLQLARQQMQYQIDLAKSGIQWRAADAKAAGIHPLAAMGSMPTYSPVSANFKAETSGDFIGKMGQDISRAAEAVMTQPQRDANRRYQEEIRKKNLQRMDLENAYLASKIATRTQTTQRAPAHPAIRSSAMLEGQGDAQGVKVEPMRRNASMKGRPSQEAGAVSSDGYLRTKTGWTPVKSEDAAARLEDDFIGNVVHAAKRYVGPLFGVGGKPKVKLKKGEVLVWNPFMAEWQKRKSRPWWAKSYTPFQGKRPSVKGPNWSRGGARRYNSFRKAPNRRYGPKRRMQ